MERGNQAASAGTGGTGGESGGGMTGGGGTATTAQPGGGGTRAREVCPHCGMVDSIGPDGICTVCGEHRDQAPAARSPASKEGVCQLCGEPLVLTDGACSVCGERPSPEDRPLPGGGRTTRKVEPDGSVVDTEYDAEGRKVRERRTSRQGDRITESDGEGTVTRSVERQADGSSRTLERLPNGSYAETVDHPDGRTQVTQPDGSKLTRTPPDEFGHRVERTFDADGNQTGERTIFPDGK